MASATRSTRSTEHDGVGGLGGHGRSGRAHRDADVGERERGRVVDAVADHHDRRAARGGAGAHARRRASAQASARRRRGRRRAHRRRPATGAALSPVTSATWRMPTSRRRARAGRRRRAAGRRSGRRRRRSRRPRQEPSRRRRVCSGTRGSTPCSRSQLRLPTSTAWPSTRPVDAAAERLHDVLRYLSCEPLRIGARDERLGERVRGEPVDARGQSQRLGGREAVERHHAARTRAGRA